MAGLLPSSPDGRGARGGGILGTGRYSGTWVARAAGSADTSVVDALGGIDVPPANPRYRDDFRGAMEADSRRAIVSDDIGGRLRRAREQRGLSLRDAARRTKLSASVVQAIERNDFTQLPGGMFRKAYVRTLAVEAGLDPGELAADYCARFEPPIEPAAEDRQVTLQEKLIEQLTPSPRRSIVTLVVLAALAAAWFVLQLGPIRPMSPVDDPASEPAVDGATPTAIAAPATDATLRVDISATGWCWVAADIDGERAVYRLVAPRERLVLEGHSKISLRVGDAGAVLLSINRGPRRSLGGGGEVADLEVTPDNVERLRDAGVETGAALPGMGRRS